MLRLGRSVSEAIIKTVSENSSDLILFGWPGTSGTNDQLFGSVIDQVVANPPADIVVFRAMPFDKLSRILVPVAGGPNGRLALSTAVALARNTEEETEVVLLYVTPPGVDESSATARSGNAFRRANEHVAYDNLTHRVVSAETPLMGILAEAENADMVIVGASEEKGFRNMVLGNVAQQLSEKAECPVLIVRRRSSAVQSVLRETVLRPEGSGTNGNAETAAPAAISNPEIDA